MKKLGFGLMRLPQDENGYDEELIRAMVDRFMESGFTYFDTSWIYDGGRSEEIFKKMIVDRYPRESFIIATKMPAWAGAGTKEDARQMFYTSLERTGAGYFDYYLLHNLGAQRTQVFEDLDLWNFIKEQKEKRLIQNIGFSMHDNAEALTKVLDAHPEVDFVQIQLNYLDWENAGIQSGECYRICTERGKKVVVMEPVKGGTLARLPEEAEKLMKAYDPSASSASWAIRFAASLENVLVVLSGMSTLEQMNDNLSYMDDFHPLNEKEREILSQVREIIEKSDTIPCTGCNYCTKDCPMQICIPQYFSLYNADVQDNSRTKGWRSQAAYYEALMLKHGKPSDCVACGQCESVRPQKINIIERLQEIDRHSWTM